MPSVDSGLCARARLLTARCEACVAACPTDALFAQPSEGGGDIALSLNAAACVGCGACRAACPENAISLKFDLPDPPNDSKNLILVCAQHPDATNGDPLPCLHGLNLSDLARYWLAGVRKLILASGSCDSCTRMPETRLQDRVEQFNRLVRCRELPEFEIFNAAPHELRQWEQMKKPDQGRRMFLRGLAAPALATPKKEDHDNTPLERFLALGQPGQGRIFPNAPRIDAETCTACDACIRICPHGALMLVKDNPEETRYAIRAEACTGCSLCVDICDDFAVEIKPMERPGSDIRLTRFRCQSCGVAQNTTAQTIPNDGLCRICRQTRHHKKLFQVME